MDIWTQIAVLLIFFVGFVTVFSFVWSKKVRELSLGYVAETCPTCKAGRPVKVIRVEMQTRIAYVPLGRARLFGYTGVCQSCSGELAVQPTDYAAFEENGNVPLESLIARTNPKLDPANESALAAFERFSRIRKPLLRASQSLEDRYAEGKGLDFPTAAAFLLACVLTSSWLSFISASYFGAAAAFVACLVPLLWCSQTLADRHGGGNRLDLPTGLALLATGAVSLAPVMLLPSVPVWIEVALFVVGLLASSALLFGEPRRFFQRELRGMLARGLKRADPQTGELGTCVLALSRYEHRICRFVSTDGLLKDLAQTPVPSIEADPEPEAEAETIPASAAPKIDTGPRGVCPNCASEIALSSAECPNPHCKALFGPHSAWQIKPV